MIHPPVKKEILALRQQIDQVNKDLAALFVKRLEITEKIGKLKVKQSLPTHDLEREKTMLESTMKTYLNSPQKKWVKSFLTQVFSLSLEYLSAQMDEKA